MKKANQYLLILLLIVLGATSCKKISESQFTPNSSTPTSDLVSKVKEISATYKNKPSDNPMRICWLCAWAAASADVVGGWEGAKIGGAIGTVVGQPVAGAIVGEYSLVEAPRLEHTWEQTQLYMQLMKAMMKN